MRRLLYILAFLIFAATVAGWFAAKHRSLGGPRLAYAPARPHEVSLRAERPRSRLFVLAINGGGSLWDNYQSHLLHLRGIVDLLHRAGVPAERITVLAGDGSDPTPDLIVKEQSDATDYWRLQGTPIEHDFLLSFVLGNSEVTGAALYPASRASLSIWLLTVGQQLRTGDTLLLYVTDHGSWGGDRENARVVLWGPGETLSVRELREALATLDPSVRVVALMSQCYSGAFASLQNLGGGRSDVTGRFCGFFSTTADRKAYGSYPETRDNPKVGHSFAFIQALPAVGGRLSLAHEMALELDDTPDVPVRTSDLYLRNLIEKAARDRGTPAAQLVDELVKGEGGDDRDGDLLGQRVRRLRVLFGLPAVRTDTAVADLSDNLQTWVSLLEGTAHRLGRSMEEMNRIVFRHFLASHPEWNGRLEAPALRTLDQHRRGQVGSELVAAIVGFSRGPEGQRALAVKRELDGLGEILFRAQVRLAALARIDNLLVSLAGQRYVEGLPAERDAWRRLVACEALDLDLPRAESAMTTVPLPPLKQDMADAQAIVARSSANQLFNQPTLPVGAPVPGLQLVPYRGTVPSVGTGRSLLVFFWRTRCALCKTVLPQVLALTGRRDLEVVAITDDSEATLDRFLERRRDLPLTVARDPGRETMFRFGVHDLPAFVLVDGSGKVASTATSSVPEIPE